MSRRKSTLRRLLNARTLRWRAGRGLVGLFPWLRRRLAFFPDSIGLLEAADAVLVDEPRRIGRAELDDDLPFLQRCRRTDSAAADYDPSQGVVIRRRTVILREPWIDMANGSFLLPDLQRTVVERGDGANWNSTSIQIARPRLRMSERVFAPPYTRNYFHLIAENALRLLELMDVDGMRDRPLVIAKQAAASRVEATFYRGVERLFPNVRVREASRRCLVTPVEAIGHYPGQSQYEWADFDDATPEKLLALFRDQYGEAVDEHYPEKLYLTRSGAKLRRPNNEREIIAALEEQGFRAFTARDDNHAEQIARFRAARVIVAVHGAGLTNLLFAAPGAWLFEIFPSNFVKSTYWWIARRRCVRHRPIYGGPGDRHTRFDVPIEALLEAVGEAEATVRPESA